MAYRFRPKSPKQSASRKLAVAEGYRSALEKSIADDLNAKGIKFTYEQDHITYSKPVRSGICGTCGGKQVGKRCTYTPDFRLPGIGGKPLYVESKGRFTGADRTKLAAIRSQYPELELRLLFAADNWTTKLHKQRYSDWANKQGFTFAVGKSVPAEWYEPGGLERNS